MPLLDRNLTEYGDAAFAAYLRGAFARLHGWPPEDLRTKPLVGICNTQSEINRCHAHFGPIVEAIKQGVTAAGGIPLVFPSMSLGEMFLSPTSMLFRNLAAMEVEELIRAQPLDAVVLLGGCDKTLPALLMGACSADVPALVVSGGPMANGRYGEQVLGACSDCRAYWQRHRAGELDDALLEAVADELAPGPGHCMVMGTASTMAACAEALGMMLLGGSTIPATHQRRLRHAYLSGQTAVTLARTGPRPTQVVTRAALLNAVRVLLAVGVPPMSDRLLAIAGRVDVPLTLADVRELSGSTPVLADVRPTGRFQMEDLIMLRNPRTPARARREVDLSPSTVSGLTLGDALAAWRGGEPGLAVVRSVAEPLWPTGGLTVLMALWLRVAQSSRIRPRTGDCCAMRVRRLSSPRCRTWNTVSTILTCP